MPKPSSPAKFGTVIGGTVVAHARTHHPRFAQVRAVIAGTMPTLRVGQVWEDMDPRCAGRTLLIETINASGTVTTRTMTPRTAPARTPAGYRLQTVGSTHTIAAYRFRPGSRGFRLTGALIRLRPDGSVVNADTVNATLGEVAPKTVPPVAKPVAKPAPKPAPPARTGPGQAGTVNVQTVATLLRDNPTHADLRVATTLCALLGTQNAAQWLASPELTWLSAGYRSSESSMGRMRPTLLRAALKQAEKQGLLA